MFGLFKKPYYFPRRDYKVFTSFRMPEELADLPFANSKLGYVNVNKSEGGIHNIAFETWHFMGGDKIRPGDVWITTSKVDGRLMSLVFVTVDCYSNDFATCSRDYTGTAQNFGHAGDLLQIERMKELVIGGKKMKPVVIK